MKIKIAKDYFIASCNLKGLASRSVENYDNYIDRFIKFSGDINLNELDYILVSEYIKLLYTGNLSIASIGTYIRHLKVFIRYLEQEYKLDPFVNKIKVPRLPKKIVCILQ